MNLDQFRADPAAVHMVVDDPGLMQRPMLPINRRGMPVPGPNFRAMAEAIRGKENPLPLAGKGKKIELTEPCVELSFLVWRALYGPLQIPIKVKTERVRAEFLPGGFYLAEGPQGPASADVMMISKHPGFDDVAQHANYSGKAATPLYEALTELGAIDEAYGWYATHLVKHANLDPTAGSVPVAWIDDGRPILEQEIALVQPRVIVCLGGEAIKELLGKEYNVTNMSQRVLTITRQVPGGFGDLATGENFIEHTIRVVALPNPASVAKRRETYPEFLEQLRFVVRTIRGEEAPRLDAGLDHQVIRTLPHLRRTIDRVLREEPAPIVAWDAEWHGQHWDAEGAFLCTVQFSHRPRSAFLLDLCDTEGRWVFQGRPEAIAAELRRLVDARGSRHGGHWFKADIPWIRKFLGVDLGPSYEPPHYAKSDGRRIVRPWDRTKHEGGWDTGYMLHAVYEDATSGKLEDVAARFLGVPHYNLELEEWKSAYCNKHKMKKKELEGYGQIDRRVLFPYALFDADVTRRLYDVFNGVGDKDGLLDKDHRGLNSRKPFWIAQQAGIVFAEMEATGVGTDEPRAIELTEVFKRTRDELLESLRAQIGWSSFNIGSTDQLTELLFGPEFHHKKTDKGDVKRLRPPEAVEPFRLTPVKSTGKPGKDWAKVVKKGEENILRPATDKETLGILMHQTDDRLVKATLRKIRDIKFIGKVLTSALRPGKEAPGEAPPDEPEAVAEYVPDVLVAGDAGLTYDGGILYYRGPGNRVRSRFYPVETGRCSSSAPNCQNLCVDADTEYMTHRGWVRAPELRPDDRVAQYWTDSGAIDFVVPTEVHVSHFKGDMHRIRTDKQIDLLVTPAHRCLLRNRQTGELTDDPATEFKPDRQHIHAGLYAGGSESLPPELVTWLCAVQADGSYHPGGGITFAFSKARKTERLRAALSALGADFTEAWSESRQVTTFYLGRPGNEELIAATKSLLGEARQFGPWILDMDRRTLDCFRDELFHWNGLFTRKTEFSSSDKINADWAQIVFALSGMRARMRLYRPKNPKAKDHHCVNITRDRTAYSMTTNFTRELVPWDDNVYCVTVPSGFIVVRREGKVSVTGNSKRREDDYARINGYWEVDKKTGERRAKGDYIIGDEDAIDGLWAEPRYTSPLRSIIREDDGYLMFEFDIKSAEVAILAWLAGDVAMMEDVRRNMLPEDHPDYIDIHSKTAVEAFKLDCPPTKKGLKSIGKVGIRVAAKNVRFGVPYGRSAAAISRQCLEEGTVVSIEDCEGLVLGYHTMYPQASAYLTACENRPIEPGWMVSPFGRYRRFAATDDDKIMASYGRSAKNFCIQSSVADWVMLLMWKLVEYRRRHGGVPGRQFEMALQVHDALVLRVPYTSVEWVWNEVVPSCIKMIPIMPRTLDGVLIPGQGPYHFGVDMELFRHWSVGLHGPDLEKLGIPAHRLKGVG